MLKFALLSTMLLVIATMTAHAETPQNKDMIEWEKKAKVFQDWYLNDPDGCNKVFNAVWPDAKKGDLNARYYLLVQMTMMHGIDMTLPTPSTDASTRSRQYIIMATHSVGSTFDIKSEDYKYYYTDEIIEAMGGVSRRSGFEECVQKARSPQCVNLAVKDGYLPSFEKFSQEIDLFAKAGYKATCSGIQNMKDNQKMIEGQ